MATSWERLARLLARDHSAVGDKGRTIVHHHGERRPRAVVLLHGLTASPSQFERYARDLFDRGHNVVVPRLPGHGHADRMSTALARMNPEALFEAADDYVAIGGELGERVTIAGFSFGGLIAAWAAQHYGVDRAVLIAPFLGVSWVPSIAMGAVSELLLRVPNQYHWWNPFLRERQMPAHGYPRFPTHAIARMYRIARSLLERAGSSAPAASRIVLVTNSREASVNNAAIRRLYRVWRGQRGDDVELAVLEGLPLSHDVVEPLRHAELAKRAYPFLLDRIDPPQP